MTSPVWAMLRGARYALPGLAGRILPEPGPAAAARTCARLRARGMAATVGYFQANGDTPGAIVAANAGVAGRLDSNAHLSIKAPPLGFDPARLDTIAQAAHAVGVVLVFDAHAPGDAAATLDAAARLEARFPGTGCAIPARWRRSMADAVRFRDTTARLRIVKGEWADPNWPTVDAGANYLALVRKLAGRSAPVGVATHDPALAEAALRLLLDAGTPCELEQLRGLPARRTMAAARRLGVPVRVYVPFGPGWWPYAIDKALARPYLPMWWLADRCGR